MADYISRFGYCTPCQWDYDELYGWDDESSYAFVVSAPTAEEALCWGSEVADAFVRHLFQKSGWVNPPSWKEAQFSYWIDDNPEQSFGPVAIAKLPRVDYKKTPEFAGW